jgi:hypothetical protein
MGDVRHHISGIIWLRSGQNWQARAPHRGNSCNAPSGFEDVMLKQYTSFALFCLVSLVNSSGGIHDEDRL